MKNAFLGAAVLITAAACNKTNNTPAPAPDMNYRPPLTVTGSYAYASGKTFQGDSTYNFLGYGYDASGKYADSSSVKHQVLDVVAYLRNNPDRFNDGFLREAGSYPIIAGNAMEMATATYRAMTSDYQLTPFKNAVTGYFPSGDALSAKYIYASYEGYVHQQRLEFSGGAYLMKPYLINTFLQDVQQLQPADLVNKYGTHILTGVIVGARFKAIYQGECNGSNKTAAANAGLTVALDSVFKIATGNTVAPGDVYLSTVTNSRLTFDVAGGNLSTIKADTTGAVPRVYLQDWLASTNAKPYFFVDMPGGALLGIEELIDDAIKKEAVKNYISTYLKNQAATLNP